MIYLDSSAVVKLAHRERESGALHAWLAGRGEPLVTSALARTEAARALMRAEPAALPALAAVLAAMYQRPIDDAVLDTAAALPGAALRSLDAIHLASALRLADSTLIRFVAYDKRLLAAAQTHGLPTASPT